MKWLTIIISYLPAVLAGVTGVEAAIKAAPGTAKKQVVLNAILAGAQAGETVPESHVAGISTLIDNVVTSLNAAGVFTKPAVT